MILEDLPLSELADLIIEGVYDQGILRAFFIVGDTKYTKQTDNQFGLKQIDVNKYSHDQIAKHPFVKNRLGLVLDFSAQFPVRDRIEKYLKNLEPLGYDKFVIMCGHMPEHDNHLPMAERDERVMMNFHTDKMYFANADGTSRASQIPDIGKEIRDWITRPIRNPIGKEWIRNELAQKRR
jgi:hypothetical protein